MKEEGLDIALEAKTPHLEPFLNRFASNLNGVFCSSLKRYHQFIDSKPIGREHGILNILSDYC